MPFLLPVCRGTWNYPRDKGCWRQPEQCAGPWDSPVTSDLKSKAEAVRCTPCCVASAPRSSSCQKGGDDLRSKKKKRGFQQLQDSLLSHLHISYTCHVPQASGLLSWPVVVCCSPAGGGCQQCCFLLRFSSTPLPHCGRRHSSSHLSKFCRDYQGYDNLYVIKAEVSAKAKKPA